MGLAGPGVQSARRYQPRGCCMIPTKPGAALDNTKSRKPAHPLPVQGVPQQSPPVLFWDPIPWPCRVPGYSRQNLRKSDCSSFRAVRNILPFSVPTTKALSSCTATQATSAFSLESAEHYRGSRVREPGKVPHPRTPSCQLWGWDVSSHQQLQGAVTLLQHSLS